MLNALRLCEGVPTTLFTERTGRPLAEIEPTLASLRQRGLLRDHDPQRIATTATGLRFLDQVVASFMI